MNICACSTYNGIGCGNKCFFACLWVAGARGIGLGVGIGFEGAVRGSGSWWQNLGVELGDGIVTDFDSGAMLAMLLVGAT